MTLQDDSPTNAPEFTVSELSVAIKRTLEDAFGYVRVRGEVGRVSRPGSGHVYLDLKDERSVLAGVIWKGQASRLATQPEEGLEMIAYGRLTTFGGQSRYQIVIDRLEPAGVGALMALLEKRKAMLRAEGLFDEARKRPLPFLPRVIGVVTSPTGAVIRDILHRLEDRFPTHVLVWPVRVQGSEAAAEISAAIEGFNGLSAGGAIPVPDLLIVARGGGSIEDLWPFNEEMVARAAAASRIPLISAVGHETDTTLIDYVADRRAPTPSAAAEMAVRVRSELLDALDERARRLAHAALRASERRREALRSAARALPRPEGLLAAQRQFLDTLLLRFDAALRAHAAERRTALERWSDRLSPAFRSALATQRAAYRTLAAHPMREVLRRSVRRSRDRLGDADRRAGVALVRLVAVKRREGRAVAARLSRESLDRRLGGAREILAGVARRQTLAAAALLARRRDRMERAESLLQSLSYRSVLARGFAIVRRGRDGPVVERAEAVGRGERLDLQFADGHVDARAEDGGAAVRPARRTAGDRKADQGSLF